MKKDNLPKVLIYDIETAPILGYVWGIWDQNIALNQIYKDWHLLSWSAKWLESEDKKTVYGPHKKIMYSDQRNIKNVEDDKELVKKIWKLLDEADIVITQNGKKFDTKKLNARFLHHGLQPPSSYKHIDVLLVTKKHFGFTSHKLEYMTDKFCTKYKKLTEKRKFSGFSLWKACLNNIKEAWKEMEKYNKHDVLSLEELYHKVISWDNSINFNLYSDTINNICKCGNTEFNKKGFAYTSIGKFQRYKCNKCGSEIRGRENLFSKEKKESLTVKVN